MNANKKILHALLSLGWDGQGWAFKVESHEDGIVITHDNGIMEIVQTVVTEADAVKALHQLIARKETNAGELITDDIDDWDAEIADMVFQQSLFGEYLFG